MLNFGPEKMIVIFFIALVVLGPDKMPEMARKLGKIMGELRKVSGGFQDEMRKVLDDTTASSGIREIKQDLTNTMRQATTLPNADADSAPAVAATALDAAAAAPSAATDAAPAADSDR